MSTVRQRSCHFYIFENNVLRSMLSHVISCYVSGEVYVPLWVKKGTLKFPVEKDTPVIMVGPGTGVAPFRSAFQERIAQGKNGEIVTFLSLSFT